VQLDQARIAIRERSWLDNLDLALGAMRAGGAGLVLSALVGVVPMILFNVAISRDFDPDAPNEVVGYWFRSIILVMLEAPLATACLTLYLGQSMFDAQPRAWSIARVLVACLPQLLLLQVVLRAVVILPLFTAFIPYGVWPYLSEVILLERNPLLSRHGQISTLKRSAALHRGGGGDAMAHLLGTIVLAVLLIVALHVSQAFIVQNVFAYEFGLTGEMVTDQVILWLVVVFFAVARFLNYLDTRIRNEGWEVELLLRAEAHRLARHAA
jgi:hypothetical protein